MDINQQSKEGMKWHTECTGLEEAKLLEAEIRPHHKVGQGVAEREVDAS